MSNKQYYSDLSTDAKKYPVHAVFNQFWKKSSIFLLHLNAKMYVCCIVILERNPQLHECRRWCYAAIEDSQLIGPKNPFYFDANP